MTDEVCNSPADDTPSGAPHVDGAASQQMQAMLNQTLSYYPEHYNASQGILATVTNHQRGWRCCGAMETCLSNEGMEVTFDYRYGKGESWRRLLVIITMADGKLTYRDYKEMAKGQHCGIMAFDAIEENVA